MPTKKDSGEPDEYDGFTDILDGKGQVIGRRAWHERPEFKDVLFVCLDDGVRYDPPPFPAVCECGKDLVVAVRPRNVPTTKTVALCSNCHTESQKATVKLANGEMRYCPVCGSTDPTITVTVPLSDDETAVITARNDERARVRTQAEAITEVRKG